MSNSIRGKVSELQNLIMASQNELFRLQAECQHPSYHLAMYSWRVGAFMPSRVCNECDASVVGITEEESQQVYAQWHQPVTGTTTIIEGDENSPTVSFFSTAGGKA